MDSLGTVVVSAIIGALVAFVGTYTKEIIEARGRLTGEIRTTRRKVYEELWSHTELLPLWPRNSSVTYQQIDALTQTLRNWYFRQGGIYLSTEAREAYSVAQELMCDAVAAHQTQLDESVEPTVYDEARHALSALRTEITRDLSSRRRSPFGT